MKPGFVGSIPGKFSPGEYRRGMHHAGMEQKFFLPHGYGINHYVNYTQLGIGVQAVAGRRGSRGADGGERYFIVEQWLSIGCSVLGVQ